VFNGWVCLHRKMLEWEWFDSDKHLRLFMVILFRSNHKVTRWRGVKVDPGQLITGIDQLSSWTNLSRQSIRTVLRDLISTGEITRKICPKYSVITITNWFQYQSSNSLANSHPTSIQQASNKQVTASNNVNNVNNVNKKNSTTGVAPSLVVECYNNTCGHILSKCKIANKKRIGHINAMSCFLKTESDWFEYFTKILDSSFLTGENDRGWRADFDWIINQNNYLKVTEGRYELREREKIF